MMTLGKGNMLCKYKMFGKLFFLFVAPCVLAECCTDNWVPIMILLSMYIVGAVETLG